MHNNAKKLGAGAINFYLKWPFVIAILLLIVFAIVIKYNLVSGLILLPFILVITIYSLFLRFTMYNKLFYTILSFIDKNTNKKIDYFRLFNVPYAVCDDNGIIISASKNFTDLSKSNLVGKNVVTIFSELNKKFLRNAIDQEVEVLSQYNSKVYNVHIIAMDTTEIYDMIKSNDEVDIQGKKVYLLYLQDESKFYDLKKQFDDMKTVVGFVSIDNYEEVTDNMEDSKVSMLMAMVDRKLNRYISNNKGIIKKLEKDKYFFVDTKDGIEDMIKDRFSILDSTREIIGEDNIPLTLSIGVGYEGKSIETNHDLANIALDMALSRGGDQAVVKKAQDLMFFGGKTNSNQTNARVRARVKATSFREILDTKDKIFILGHKFADMDAFGASLGIYVMANFLKKKVYIVENTITKDVNDAKERLIGNNSISEDVFIDGEEALKLYDEDSILCLVDHNSPSISDEPRLIDNASFNVVFDHHRASVNSIQNAIISYVEPSASSTCELISEIIEYFDDRIKINSNIADCMLCGIIVDTNNFTFMTNSKTFDAASFLKRSGADISKVRKMLRVDKDFDDFKNDVKRNVEYYKDSYAIATLENIEGIDAQVLASQVANELVDINNVKASIVILHSENNKYKISARSIDEANVQVMLEKIGGGGHRGAAGAEVEASSVDEVISTIKGLIDDMIKNKEIT